MTDGAQPATQTSDPPPAATRRSLWTELKRRRVPRAAIAYLVAASGMLQGIEAASNAYDLPLWLVTAVRAVVVVGFPINLVVAWFFDIAPARPGEGPGETAHPRTGRGLFAPERRIRLRKPTWAAIVAMAVAVAGLAGWRILNRSRGGAGPPGIKSVLIADFVNRTGDAIFDGTLEPALALAMEGASFVTSFSRPAALRIAEQLKLDGAGLSDGRARLVASREGISVVTTGSIEHDGGYRVTVQAVDGLTGKQIVKASKTVAGKQAVLAAVTRVAARVREALGDATPEAVQLAAGETFSAASLEAAHEYSQANAAQLAGRWELAIQHYLAAVKLDPGLGRAYSGLAVVENNRGHHAEAERYFLEAMAHVDRMSEREKYRTRGAYYLVVHRDPDKAIEALSALVKQFPADNSALANLAVAYQLKRDFARAVAEGRRAIAIYPNNVPQRNNVGLFAMYMGDFDAAVKEQQKVLELHPTFVLGYQGLALAQLASGQRDAAVATWRKLQAIGPAGESAAAEGLADLALAEGRLAGALEILEKAILADEAARDGDALARKLAMIASVHLARGETTLAVAAARRARTASTGEFVTFQAATVLAEAGQEAEALAIASELDHRLPSEPRMYAELIRGTVELRRTDYPAAVNRFQSAVQRLDSWMARQALGRAYVEAGAFVQAQEELERCEKRRGEATDVSLDVVPTYRLYPPVLYLLGRAHEGLRSAGAAEWYARFVATVRSEELPLVADARRRLARSR